MATPQLVSLFEALPRDVRREVVRIVVEELKYSKSEVARIIGVTPSAITRFMRGDAAPSPESLAKLFAGLEPEGQAAILRVILEYISSLVKSIAPILAVIAAAVDTDERRVLEVVVEELIDNVSVLLEAAEGYSGAHSSPSRLGERISSPPSAAESFSRRRSRL